MIYLLKNWVNYSMNPYKINMNGGDVDMGDGPQYYREEEEDEFFDAPDEFPEIDWGVYCDVRHELENECMFYASREMEKIRGASPQSSPVHVLCVTWSGAWLHLVKQSVLGEIVRGHSRPRRVHQRLKLGAEAGVLDLQGRAAVLKASVFGVFCSLVSFGGPCAGSAEEIWV